MKFFSVDDIEMIHLQIIDASGGSLGVRDRGRLESVVASQYQHVFETELYPGVFQKAAAICRGLVADHPFIDGNKRTASLSAIIFLERNNVATHITDKELEDFAVQVATNHLEVEQITDWLRAHA